ncbi:reverse transcriptase domain-containing protein [Tanacetum coccineum]
MPLNTSSSTALQTDNAKLPYKNKKKGDSVDHLFIQAVHGERLILIQFVRFPYGFDFEEIQVLSEGRGGREGEEKWDGGSGEFSVKDTRLAIDDLMLPSHSEPTRWEVLHRVCRWWEIDFQLWRSFSEWDEWFSSIRLPGSVKVGAGGLRTIQLELNFARGDKSSIFRETEFVHLPDGHVFRWEGGSGEVGGGLTRDIFLFVDSFSPDNPPEGAQFDKRLSWCIASLGHGITPSGAEANASFFLTLRYSSSHQKQMASPVEGGGPEGTDDREETPPPLTKEKSKAMVFFLVLLFSVLLIKSHNRKNKGGPIRLDFETEDTEFAGPEYKMPNIKLYDGTTDPKDHLSRFASAANSGEWPMPVWCRMFQQTLDGSARGWFERLPHHSVNEWADLREAFAARFSVRRTCFKEPHEITKIIRKANESLTAFKERWTVETGFIMGVPEVMKISSFMDSVKSPELAKHFSDKVPTTVNEMMERLDDFVRSEEAYANIELPKGETGESHHKISFPSNGRDVWPLRNTRLMESRRDDYRNRHRGRDTYCANRPRDDKAPYPPPRGEYN